MRRLMIAAGGALALVIATMGPMSTPASAYEETLCNNEPGSDIWWNGFVAGQEVFVGTDANSGGAIYVCVNRALVAVGTDHVELIVCTHHSPDSNPDNDNCQIRQP